MILIDTDHVSYFKFPDSDRGKRFIRKLEALPDDKIVGVAIVTIEERLRGWLAAIAKERQALRQVVGYRELSLLFEFYHEFTIIPFDESAARKFDDLRAAKLRLGTMDLKIAAIALVHDVTLLSANQRDFDKVPNLRVENWLD